VSPDHKPGPLNHTPRTHPKPLHGTKFADGDCIARPLPQRSQSEPLKTTLVTALSPKARRQRQQGLEDNVGGLLNTLLVTTYDGESESENVNYETDAFDWQDEGPGFLIELNKKKTTLRQRKCRARRLGYGRADTV
jgi:hypothetical protein